MVLWSNKKRLEVAILQEEKKELKNGVSQGKKIYSLQETKLLFPFL